MSIICKNCSSELGDSVKFCPYCGTKVEIEQPVTETYASQEENVADNIAENVVENENVFSDVSGTVVNVTQPEKTVSEMSAVEPEFVPEPVEETVAERPEKANDIASANEPKPAVEYAQTPQKTQVSEISQAHANEMPFAGNGGAFVQNSTVPTGAPTVPPMTKQAKKMAERMAKEKAKQEEKAKKLAEKNAKKIAKTEKEVHTPTASEDIKEKKTRKVTPLGVVCTIFLTLLLIVNVCLCYTLVLGVGVSKSVQLDKEVEAFYNDDTQTLGEMWQEIKDDGNALTVETKNGEYTIELSDDVIDALNVFFTTNDGERAFATLEKSFDVLEISLVGSAGYVALVMFIIICAIFVSLGKSRRAFLIPGITFTVFGLLSLVCSVVGAVSPVAFGVAVIETLFGFDTFAKFALLGAATTAVLGVVFIAIGASGKEKA